MMPSAKIAIRSTAPPASRLNIPRMPVELDLNIAAKAAVSIPGSGMNVPNR